MPCATKTRTWCHSGYVNSRSSYLETHSLLSSQCDSKSRRSCCAFIPAWQQMRTAHTCGNLCWCACIVYVCVCLGACCASIFTARISDKPNESPESCYLLAYSCSVLSSLFSGSLFPFLLSFPLLSPLLAVCFLIHCLSLPGGFLPLSAHKLPSFVLATQAHPH